MSTFNLLHDKVQAFIYAQKWTAFRPIQDEAIKAIKTSSANLLISAPTASGKTEAAFLPIVSKIADNYSGSYRAVYILPLKALINDQFKRIDEICNEIGIPVSKWHGDVGQTQKKKSLESPAGILLITPESLEAMLINKPTLVRKAFATLSYFVIDEIHSFVGTERGLQLLSLMNRISIEAKCTPIKIGLSATLGNPQEVATWLDPNKPCQVIEDEDWNDSIDIEGIIRGFTSKKDNNQDSPSTVLNPSIVESIYLNFLQGKNLIFGNSKRKLEETAYLVTKIANNRGRPNQFQIHHGSLSKFLRETTENELKMSDSSLSVFCTSTLEMGIDIGAIEKIGLLDPPWSVSGFAQRLGRSGRRAGTSKKFEFLINHQELSENLNISEELREDLVKSIAIVLLYLKGFKEPLDIKSNHPSTLVHQILSHCVQYQGATFESIKSILIDPSLKDDHELNHLLNHLCDCEFLFKDMSHRYIAGRIGEMISSDYEFYSVFLSSEQWSVIHDSQLIGQIPVIGTYKEDDNLLLGGRVWTIIAVSDAGRRLIVRPATNAKAPTFNASFGITHPAIHEMMREVYTNDTEYLFLDSEANRLLKEARQTYFQKVDSPNKNRNIFPIFEGSKVQTTVSALLNICKIDFGMSEVTLDITNRDPDWKLKFESQLGSISDELDLARRIDQKNKVQQKYDRYLPSHLLDSSYSNKFLDIPNTIKWLKKLS